MHHAIRDTLYFIGVSVVLQFFVVEWIKAAVRALVWKLLLRTERAAAVYMHHRLRVETKKAVHAPKRAEECSDGECVKIK